MCREAGDGTGVELAGRQGEVALKMLFCIAEGVLQLRAFFNGSSERLQAPPL